MGDATSGDGGNDDPDRAWRRPAPGEPERAATVNPSFASPGGASDDPQRAIWGPGADDGGHARVVPAPVTPPVWHPPAVGAPPANVAASIPPQRWEPVVGPAGAGDPWGGWSGPPGSPELGIDERTAPPPRQPANERHAGWWTRGGIAAAVLAAVLVVVAVASNSDPGGEASTATSTPTTTSAPPSTTARRAPATTDPSTTTTDAPTTTGGNPADADPADLEPEDDPRVMLTDLPDGYTARYAQLMLDNHVGGMTSGLLFVADGSTWFDGPWIQIRSPYDASFIGPVTPVDVGGGRLGRLGTDQAGAELLALDVGDPGVAIAVRGLPPGTASTIAAALAIGTGDTWSLPADAVPTGFHLATGNLAASMAVRPTSSAVVNYEGPGGVGLTVYASLADPDYDPQSVAGFYMTDVSYVTVGGEPGLLGTYRYGGGTSFQSLQWRHLGVDIDITSFGLEPSELLALAASASTRADGGWTERTWDAAEEGSSEVETPDPVLIEQDVDFGEHGTGVVMVQRLKAALSWWVDANGLGISRFARAADQPVVLQVASNPVAAIDTDGTSYVLALALGDASIEGATLRVRSGAAVSGGDGIGHDSGAIVHSLAEPSDDAAAGAPTEFGYTLGAAVAVPWPEGEFIAELVAADGVTILATATRNDLQ